MKDTQVQEAPAAETEVIEESPEVEASPNAESEAISKEDKKEPVKVSASPIQYFEDAKVVCACGNSFTTGSTKAEIRVEICNNCHPFYTGQEKFVDTEGRVERFQRLNEAKREPKVKKEAEKKAERPKTLRDMLTALENK